MKSSCGNKVYFRIIIRSKKIYYTFYKKYDKYFTGKQAPI